MPQKTKKDRILSNFTKSRTHGTLLVQAAEGSSP
jgi:hypothetical protein